jgi:hypothetical protein
MDFNRGLIRLWIVISGIWMAFLLGLGLSKPLEKYQVVDIAESHLQDFYVRWLDKGIKNESDFDAAIANAELAQAETDAVRLREIRTEFKKEQAILRAKIRLAENELYEDLLMIFVPPIVLGLFFFSFLWVVRGFKPDKT